MERNSKVLLMNMRMNEGMTSSCAILHGDKHLSQDVLQNIFEGSVDGPKYR